MMQRAVNPGSIQVRLGAVLHLIENAFAGNDLPTAANLIDLAATYVSVHLDAHELEAYERMPGLSYGDNRTTGDVHRDLQKRLRYLLGKAKQHNLFAKMDVAAGDASSLDSEEELAVA